MSGNSSSCSNDSLLSNFSSIPFYICFVTRPSSIIYSTYNITNILLLLPLCTVILYLGLQRWRQQRSTNAALTSHSDVFTYHMVIIELVGVSGQIFCICGAYSVHVSILAVAYYLWSFTWYGEMSFHILTCFERYLAVVHPITYMNLRGERGIRIRNIIIVCIWLLCIGAISLKALVGFSTVVNFCILFFTLTVISFCSLSVLYVLIRPGPGEQGGNREGVDQSKQRAFYTIVAILGVLVLKVSGELVWSVLNVLSGYRECVAMAFISYFNLPSSLVLPLLFLHRAGKLACRKDQIPNTK